MDNMLSNCSARSRALLVGSACIVFSTLTPEEIKLFATFRPEALEMKDPDSGETFFHIEIDEEGPGSLNEDCAVFSDIPTEDGKATITILIDPGAKEHRRELVESKLGSAMARLNFLEEKLREQLPEVKAEQDTIRTWIMEM